LFAYLLALVVLLVAILLAYGGGVLLHLHGTPLLLLWVLMVLAGLAAAAAMVILHLRRKKSVGQTGAAGGGDTSDLDLLLNDAVRKLRTSQQGGAKSLASLPLLYVVGEVSSAKTTLVSQSGLDPEMIAGLSYRVGEVPPTPLVNVWYTRQVAIIEAGNAIRNSESLLNRLVSRTRPKAYRTAFGSGAPARAAVVCVSVERFLGPDATNNSIASARTTGAQLRQISRNLGTSLPVYVIFTKLDRVPHFAEFVRNLSSEEAQQVFGTTLSKSQSSAGVYTDQATQELGRALDSLCFSLSEFRLDLLAREINQRTAAEVYEFPRELRKLRNNLTQYLVELCKPSQLSANPYLRGFYFTGVRAQIVEQAVSAPAAAPKSAPQDVGATRMFAVQEMRQAAATPEKPAVISQKVAQWTFLARLFPQVILGDKSALQATQQTAPARLFRRLLFGGVAALLCIYIVLLFLSYANNSALEDRLRTAAKTFSNANIATGSMPATRDLRALDQLRLLIQQLDSYRIDGPPLMYRWGLYQGDRLAASARKIYFDHFRQLLLTPAQTNFLAYLRTRPDAPAEGADYSEYSATYNPLKAYLITTTNPEKSSADFLTPVFLRYLIAGRQVDSDQLLLARQQADFYANELVRQNPYSINPDTAVVSHARSYLSKFGNIPRIYQDMLTAAGKTNPAIDFNQRYPGSRESVVDSHVVKGAFTRNGFTFMQDAIQHPDRYFKGDTWVLGEQSASSLDPASVTRQISDLYANDYIKEWHAFLIEARVVSCGNMHEAPTKLNALSSPSSPLLELVYTVSHNTAVANPQISSVFQPTQQFVDPNAVDRFIGPPNATYINALLTLSSVVAPIAQNPAAANDPASGAAILNAAATAESSTRQTGSTFSIDSRYQTEKTLLSLMLAPIGCVKGLAGGVGKAGINGAGQKVCASFNALMAKFPFSPNSQTQATVAEVSDYFAPDTGLLWQTYNASLKQVLVPQGSQYVAAPNAPFPVTPGFNLFFNRAAGISAGFFPPPAKTPTLNFTLHEIPSKGIQTALIAVDLQRITGENAVQQFTWNAATAQQAQLSYNSGGTLAFSGPWALFKLLGKARATRSAGVTQLEFPVEISNEPVKLPDGTPEVVRFELSGQGAELLTPGALNGLRCASPVLK
jgi:type VI secretion system protein ImpL